MSNINDLIKELCPNGVIYKKYGDVFEIKTGKGITTKEATDDGLYPIISGGTTPMGYYHSYNRDENIVTVSRVGANAGYVNFITEKFYLNDKCFSIIPKDEFVKCFIPKYIYHYTKNIENKIMELQSEGGVPTINTQKVSNLLMPMLPIDVQLEIINILDKFGELEAELETELEARKSQYEFWCGKLFEKENVKYMKISEFAKCYAGATPSTSHSEYWKNGTIPWMSSGEVNNIEIYDTEKKITKLGYNSSSTKMLPINTVVVALAGQGKTRGLVAITRKEVCTNQSLCGIVPDERVDNEYLFHYLQSRYKDLRRISSGDGTRGGLNLKMINDYEVPVPDIDEQKKIISVLNRFSRLVNSYTDGLPAEIELRRKQYEYYRNKLLSFEELSVSE